MSATPSITTVPGKPGVLKNTITGEEYDIGQVTEDSFFDTQAAMPTVNVSGQTITAGTRKSYFDALNTKNGHHTNIKQIRAIPQGNVLTLTRIGCVLSQAIGNTVLDPADAQKVVATGAMEFKLSEQKIASGPLFKFPGGYGVVGSTTQNNAGVVSNGVASPAAIPSLFMPQPVRPQDALNLELRFDGADWVTSYAAPILAGPVYILMDLHGIVKIAAIRG